MTASTTDSLVILLHGVGSRGADILQLAGFWRSDLPRARFAAPDAPFASGLGAGRQWFSVVGVNEANRTERVVAARESFDRVLADIVRAHGYEGRLERVALVGFSQGTIMALDALASGRWPVAGVIGFSGRLASPEPLSPSRATKLLLVHGEADAIMPASESVKAAERLRKLGVEVELALLPGVGHTITAEGAALALRSLAKTVGA